MKTNNVVGQVSKPAPEELVRMYETFDDGQCSEIRRQFREGTLTTEHVQRLIEHKETFPVIGVNIVQPTISETPRVLSELPTLDDFLTAWPEFCKEFNLAVEVDFASLMSDKRITIRRPCFDWLVYCPKGMTSRQALELCKKQFKVWEEIDVDGYSLERSPDKTDLILFRATVEPDKEWLGKTSDYMSATATPFLDARERYMLEAFYFWLTKSQSGQGRHLDIKGWTRCPRSRSGRRVAGAYWNDGKFCANWSYADLPLPNAGGREAVPL